MAQHEGMGQDVRASGVPLDKLGFYKDGLEDSEHVLGRETPTED